MKSERDEVIGLRFQSVLVKTRLLESSRNRLKQRRNVLAHVLKNKGIQLQVQLVSGLSHSPFLTLPPLCWPCSLCDCKAATVGISTFSFSVRVSSRSFSSYCFSLGPLPVPEPITMAEVMQCSDSLGPVSHALSLSWVARLHTYHKDQGRGFSGRKGFPNWPFLEVQ